eukprot:Rmarinus@m.26460
MKEWECFVAVDAMLLLFMVSAGVAARVFPVKSSRDFVSANCSQTAVSIGFTFYASSFGASLLYATPEVGAIAGIVGVIGNAVAATLPFFVFAVLGPYMQRNMDSHHATVSEYLPHRLGPWMSFQVSTISLFMMFIFIVAELSAVGDVIEYIVPQTEGAIHMASVSVVTTAYTCYGGFRASLLTDRFQGFITLFLSILVSVAIFRDVHVTSEEWESSGVLRSTAVGHRSAFTLAVAIVASILFHQGFWQRALAARDASTLRHGCLLAGLFVFPTVTLFGVVGMVAKADDEDVEPSLGFFHLLSQLRGSAWDYVTIILAVALVAGGVDSLQNGITSIIARDFLLNLPERITGLLWDGTVEAASVAGCYAGLFAVIIQGWVILPESGDGALNAFLSGFEMIALPGGLYEERTLVAFVLAPSVSFVVTVLLSYLLVWTGFGTSVSDRLQLVGSRMHAPLRDPLCSETSFETDVMSSDCSSSCGLDVPFLGCSGRDSALCNRPVVSPLA